MPDTAADDTWSQVIAMIRKAAFDSCVGIEPGSYIIFWNADGACRVISAFQENFHFGVFNLNGWYANRSLPINL